MSENKKKESELRLFKDAEEKLSSANVSVVIRKLHELKTSGNAAILPLVLDLLISNQSKAVNDEVLVFIGQLKDQKCVPVLVEYINIKKAGLLLGDLISECWQSGLDFSQYLNVFADNFITGDYQVALEAFTVIEEMLWKSTLDAVTDCRKYLLDRKDEIHDEKKSLFTELIKVLDKGTSQNAEDYPEFFEH
jgi:hypothetical protein